MVIFYSIVGYDVIALTLDFEFPSTAAAENAKSKKSEKKAVAAAGSKIQFPAPINYELPLRLEPILKAHGRRIKIYNRINIKIKQSDINSHLHHLVNIETRRSKTSKFKSKFYSSKFYLT